MNGSSTERLYPLLPSVYRARDAEQGEPLRKLLWIIEAELNAVEGDISHLYENWFIETCDQWVIPYIGGLLGTRILHPIESAGLHDLRAYVANTIAYRRRKGTATILEQLAKDLTGWTARAVEYFQLLATTQHIDHLRPANKATADLRDRNAMELLNGPFEQTARLVDVRSIAKGQGKYNIPNIGLFLWRLQSYFVDKSQPCLINGERYTFDPLGNSVPLFTRPIAEQQISHLAEEVNVPGPLRRLPLDEELKAARKAVGKGLGSTVIPQSLDEKPAFRVFLDDNYAEVPKSKMTVCELGAWDKAGWQNPLDNPSGPEILAGIDPVCGRLVCAPGHKIKNVSYAYGFGSDLGGGPYDRRLPASDGAYAETVTAPQQFGDVINVSSTKYKTVTAALSARDATRPTVIQIESNQTFNKPNLTITMNGADLVVQAANRKRPVVCGKITVTGGAAPGRLTLDGIVFAGRLEITPNSITRLRIRHCTIRPRRKSAGASGYKSDDAVSLTVQSGNPDLLIEIERSITGPLKLPADIAGLQVQDSIIQSHDGDPAIEFAAAQGVSIPPTVTLKASTIFGEVKTTTLTLASEVIFTGIVTVQRKQSGCLRYCYVPDGSHTPRRFQCQPESAISLEAKKQGGESLPPRQAELICQRLRPHFTSMEYGQPGYGQLGLLCAEEIRTGAEDGAEIGAFNHLKQAQRENNLLSSVEEYLRFGMEAGIFYMT